MDIGIAVEDLMRICEVFATFPKVRQVVLFGSRAMGNYKSGSDIDLAIIGEGVTFDDILEIQDSLEQLGMLYRFDLQNLNAIHDTDVKDHIDRVGKIIYIKGVSSDTK
jgi:predicted nucleotidyltransferase